MCMDNTLMRDFGQIARMLYEKGWSEGFGGNISVCIRSEGEHIIDKCCKDIHPVSMDINIDTNPLNNSIIAITESGSRMYEVGNNPAKHIAILFIENGSVFNMSNKTPSSELIAHLQTYISNPSFNALIHTHPPFTIAASELTDTENKFNRTLKESHTEFSIIFNKGIAVIERKKPGSMELAQETAKRLSELPLAVWKHHGVIAGESDIYRAFDLIDVVEKCSHIALLKII